jgi:hypothetical protein
MSTDPESTICFPVFNRFACESYHPPVTMISSTTTKNDMKIYVPEQGSHPHKSRAGLPLYVEGSELRGHSSVSESVPPDAFQCFPKAEEALQASEICLMMSCI